MPAEELVDGRAHGAQPVAAAKVAADATLLALAPFVAGWQRLLAKKDDGPRAAYIDGVLTCRAGEAGLSALGTGGPASALARNAVGTPRRAATAS